MDNSIEKKLLEYLDRHPFHSYADIKEYFKLTYPKHTEHPMDFKVVLDECIEQNLIRLSDQESYKKLGERLVTFNEYINLNNLVGEIKGKIKMGGRSYLNEQKRLEKQDRINFTQVLLAIAIAGATIFQARMAWITYNNGSAIEKTVLQLKESQQSTVESIQNKSIYDSILLRQIKDSLKIP